MAIAALNAGVLATIDQIANLDLDIMLIDQNRQSLNLHLTELQSDYSSRLTQKTIKLEDLDSSDKEEKSDLELEWEHFKLEFQVAEDRLNAQDKALEMQRTALQTKKEQLTTSLESQEKRLQKNEEADFKGFS